MGASLFTWLVYKQLDSKLLKNIIFSLTNISKTCVTASKVHKINNILEYFANYSVRLSKQSDQSTRREEEKQKHTWLLHIIP